MKRTFLLSILTMALAAMLPVTAAGKIAPDRKPAAESDQPTVKYEAFVGYGYTSLNQLNGSRNGLQGVSASVTRDWGKYFGITGEGGYYRFPYDAVNPGKPDVSMVLVGPVLHTPLIGKTSGFIHVLLGGEHTGGNNQTPNIALAGGFGGGLDYSLKKHWSLRLYGDDIISSFTLANPFPGSSTHQTRSARASFGVVYKF